MSYFLDICGCILRSPKKVDSTQYYIKLTTKIHFRTDLHLPCTSLRITRSGNCFNLAVRLCLTSMRCNDVRTTSFCCQCPLGKSPRRPIGALNFSITLSFSARISCVCVGGGGRGGFGSITRTNNDRCYYCYWLSTELILLSVNSRFCIYGNRLSRPIAGIFPVNLMGH